MNSKQICRQDWEKQELNSSPSSRCYILYVREDRETVQELENQITLPSKKIEVNSIKIRHHILQIIMHT